MSRIAKYPVDLPKGVETNFAAEVLSVKGPMGSLSQAIHQSVQIVKEGDTLTFHPADETSLANAMSGTMRALVANMVTGVTKGFERKLTLVGVGYLQFKFEIAQGPQAQALRGHLALLGLRMVHAPDRKVADQRLQVLGMVAQYHDLLVDAGLTERRELTHDQWLTL